MLSARDTRRFLRKYRVRIVLASSLAALLWLALSSESFQDCVKANYSDNGQQSLYERAAYLIWASKFCGGVFLEGNNGGITALATVLLVGLNAALWVVTGKSAEIAERALTQLERPHLYIASMDLAFAVNTAPGATNSPLPKITFVIRNYGRTPANMIRAVFRIRFLDHEPTDADDIDVAQAKAGGLLTPAEVIIGAGDPWEQTLFCENEMGLEERQWIQEGKEKGLYFWGYLEYRDIFSNEHPTVFCRRYNMITSSFLPVGGIGRNYGE